MLGVSSRGLNELDSDEEKSQYHLHALSHDQTKRAVPHGNREERSTYLKAILSQPDLSPTQVLAKKFAEESLKSPRMQATFKRLSEVRSPGDDENVSKKIMKTVNVIRSVKSVGHPPTHHRGMKHNKKRKRKNKTRKHSAHDHKRSHHKHHRHTPRHHHAKHNSFGY